MKTLHGLIESNLINEKKIFIYLQDFEDMLILRGTAKDIWNVSRKEFLHSLEIVEIGESRMTISVLVKKGE